MTDTPPAVPLDLCLQRIYDPNGETTLEVDTALKILNVIIQNNGLEKFRSVNATKILSRISNPNNLSLWYVLRHAGFYKEGDRLICPITVQLDTISNVVSKLNEVVDHNAKIKSGEISSPRYTPRQQQSNNNSQEQGEQDSSGPVIGDKDTATMKDDIPSVQPETQPQPTQQPLPQSQNTLTTTTPTTATPTQEQSPSSPTQSSPSGNALGSTKQNVSNMTAEEKRAYVAALMAQKKASAKK